ncbi:MAG: flagellar hook-length control protein FliK, partial [Marinobacter sp.]|nr:flagellar hook-length control protein FliK [Marinobacter sp.]
MSNIKSVAMKLPSGQQIPSPPSQPTPGTARPAGATEPGREAVAASARQLLDQVQLANRETTLARVAEVINRQAGSSAEVLLDIRGKPLLVETAIGKTELAPGDWVKVMRAGNELQLMGKLAPAPEAGIARALAQRLPWQQALDGGLAKLMGTLTQGLKQEPLPGQLPSARQAQPLPEAARQTIEQLV